MFNSMYYKCGLVQKLTGDEANCRLEYRFTMNVNGSILSRVTLSEEEIETGGQAHLERSATKPSSPNITFPHEKSQYTYFPLFAMYMCVLVFATY